MRPYPHQIHGDPWRPASCRRPCTHHGQPLAHGQVLHGCQLLRPGPSCTPCRLLATCTLHDHTHGLLLLLLWRLRGGCYCQAHQACVDGLAGAWAHTSHAACCCLLAASRPQLLLLLLLQDRRQHLHWVATALGRLSQQRQLLRVEASQDLGSGHCWHTCSCLLLLCLLLLCLLGKQRPCLLLLLLLLLLKLLCLQLLLLGAQLLQLHLLQTHALLLQQRLLLCCLLLRGLLLRCLLLCYLLHGCLLLLLLLLLGLLLGLLHRQQHLLLLLLQQGLLHARRHLLLLLLLLAVLLRSCLQLLLVHHGCLLRRHLPRGGCKLLGPHGATTQPASTWPCPQATLLRAATGTVHAGCGLQVCVQLALLRESARTSAVQACRQQTQHTQQPSHLAYGFATPMDGTAGWPQLQLQLRAKARAIPPENLGSIE
jgi:hypothetical protein